LFATEVPSPGSLGLTPPLALLAPFIPPLTPPLRPLFKSPLALPPLPAAC